jgi:peptidoglycan/xylan/chitin deacetylase (PgdA/CDA1 family)
LICDRAMTYKWSMKRLLLICFIIFIIPAIYSEVIPQTVRSDTTRRIFRPGDTKSIEDAIRADTSSKKEDGRAPREEPESQEAGKTPRDANLDKEKSTVDSVGPAKVALAESVSEKSPDKVIAVTFDYLPGEQIYSLPEKRNITEGILSALKKHEAPAAGFVAGEYMEGPDWENIVAWLDGGHVIGFHTYSGQDILGMPVSVFIEDIMRGKEAVEDLVTTYRQEGRYFRYPYLHYPTDERSKEMIIDRLIEARVRIAHVSITVEDFVFNMSYEKISRTGREADIYRLRNEYLEHILECLARAETVADEVAGRPVRHILELRVNGINAQFLDDILTELESKGYSFIPLREALRDPIYREEEDYFGDRGLSYLERIKYSR